MVFGPGVFGQLGRHLAQRLGQQPLELPHTRLAGVVGGDLAQRGVGHRDLVVGQRRTFPLPGQQVVAGDGDLVVFGVAVDLHQLHAVQQRRRDVLDHVGGGQEHHVGQVQVQIQVVVAERVVLRRVEHLEQRRTRVAAVVGADLVDLVQQHNGIHRSRLADRTHDPARQRAHVGAPVPADLGLVAHTAQGDAHELAAQRPGHALAQRCLADAGRTGQHHHRARATAADDLQPALGAPGAHRQILDDAVLDVVQPVVVGVQDLPRRRQVRRVLGADVPRQVEHGVQPGADPAAFRALVAGAFQLADLAQRGLAHLLGQVGGLDAGPVVIGPVGFALAQLLADGGELLAQQELLLRLLHALAHVLGDLVVDLDLGQVVAGPVDQHAQPLGDIGRLQQLPLLHIGQVGRVSGRVRQRRRIGQAVDVVDDLPGLAPLQHGQQQLLVLRRQRLDLVGCLRLGRPRSPRPTAPLRARWLPRRCVPGVHRAPRRRCRRRRSVRPAGSSRSHRGSGSGRPAGGRSAVAPIHWLERRRSPRARRRPARSAPPFRATRSCR